MKHLSLFAALLIAGAYVCSLSPAFAADTLRKDRDWNQASISSQIRLPFDLGADVGMYHSLIGFRYELNDRAKLTIGTRPYGRKNEVIGFNLAVTL